MDQEKGLLEGVVVLDLTRVLAGPYCGALMADMGATVIKVEQPGKGDDSRSMGPFVNEQSVYYANFNRSKLGVTLNLKDLQAVAKEVKVKNWWTMKKADLLQVVADTCFTIQENLKKAEASCKGANEEAKKTQKAQAKKKAKAAKVEKNEENESIFRLPSSLIPSGTKKPSSGNSYPSYFP